MVVPTDWKIFHEMPLKLDQTFSASEFKAELGLHGNELGELPGWMFEGLLLYASEVDHPQTNSASDVSQQKIITAFGLRMKQACNTARFAGAQMTKDLADKGITHVLIGEDRAEIRALREKLSQYLSCSSLKTVFHRLTILIDASVSHD